MHSKIGFIGPVLTVPFIPADDYTIMPFRPPTPPRLAAPPFFTPAHIPRSDENSVQSNEHSDIFSQAGSYIKSQLEELSHDPDLVFLDGGNKKSQDSASMMPTMSDISKNQPDNLEAGNSTNNFQSI